jgi:hypothetical protein
MRRSTIHSRTVRPVVRLTTVVKRPGDMLTAFATCLSEKALAVALVDAAEDAARSRAHLDLK